MKKRIAVSLMTALLFCACCAAAEGGGSAAGSLVRDSAVLPEELVGTWQGTGQETDGGDPVELTLRIFSDGSGECTFFQDNRTEVCGMTLSYEEGTFTVSGDSVTRFSGSWELTDGQLAVHVDRTFPSGLTRSYLAACVRAEGGSPAAGEAEASGDEAAVNSVYASVLNDEMPSLPGEAVPYGRILVAVYEYGNDTGPRLSCDEAGKDGWHGLPADRLASCLDEAQTLILIYPREVQSNPVQTYICTTVCVVDRIRNARYDSWWADRKQKISTPVISLGRGLGTMGGDSDVSMDVDKAMEQVLLRMENAAGTADENLYRQAQTHFDEELYYTARREFLQSLWGDWNERAADCIRSWPENGTVWEKNLSSGRDTQLTIRVNQPEDSAFFARLYLDGQACSGLFIGGTGEATASLPGGTYSIKAGSGGVWYGARELFGESAAYQSMTFDENGSETVELESGYAYTLEINVSVSSGGTGVGSEEESWENVVE